MPEPLQSGQVAISELFSAPEPWHFVHCSNLGTIICFVAPEAASSKVISRSYLKSLPLFGPLLLAERKLPPPKKLSKMSSKSKPAPEDIKSEKSKPSKPCPAW